MLAAVKADVIDPGRDESRAVFQLVRPHGRPARWKPGADALVLFNRFYQPDFDIETPDRRPLAGAEHARTRFGLPLLWIALLHGRVKASLAATTGVHSAVEAIKYLMAGADVVMSTSALLQQGPPFFARSSPT